MTAHLQSFHRMVGGGTASVNIDLGAVTHISADSYCDDRMVEIAFAHGRLRMHRAEFANLLRRGPEAIVKDTDFYLDCNCSGAVADLEQEDIA